MTKVKKLLILMSDGKERSRAEIAQEMGVTDAEAYRALKTAKRAKNVACTVFLPSYQITQVGKIEAFREGLSPEVLERRRRLRNAKAAAKKRLERAAIRAENLRISAQLDAEREELKTARMTHRATSGKIPNSVFALGEL